MNYTFEATFLGTSGSCAYNSGKRKKYGTNTLCVALKAGNETLVFDAGTGICGLSSLPEYAGKRIQLFLSHYHLDHIGGLLFCPEMFVPDKEINIYGYGNAKSIINASITPPLQPVTTDCFQANLKYHLITHGESIKLPGDITIHTYSLSHPGDSLGFRVEYKDKIFCYCVDVDLADHDGDEKLIDFIRDADLLVFDSFFKDGAVIPGWGHSSSRECAEWAARANAKKLALFHYNFSMTDESIDEMEKNTQTIFPGTFAAADFMRVVL